MTPLNQTSRSETRPHSRRALLAGALGGLGALAASAIGRATPTEAAAGDALKIGRVNEGGGSTTELRSHTSQPVFRAVQSGGGNALRGEAQAGRGVVGIGGSNGTGLSGYSPNHNAVFASTDTGYCVNVRALGTNSVGIYSTTYGQNATAIWAIGPSRFWGPMTVTAPIVLTEQTVPTAPPVDQLKLFARDDGFGKTQLCVRFPTGAVQVVATEP
jgi:hypothetical protein